VATKGSKLLNGKDSGGKLAFRNFLTIPDISPEEIVGLARAIRVIQRLPISTPGVDISISLEFITDNYVASSTVRLSPELIEAERSAASRVVSGEPEFESFPGFSMSFDLDGDYEIEGDKLDFLNSFIMQPDDLKSSAYSVSVTDDSCVTELPPNHEDG
jgi:hypothetical protein